jgi:hypothetical protein
MAAEDRVVEMRQRPGGAESTTTRPAIRPEATEDDRDDRDDGGHLLVCAHCARFITTTAARIQVAGAHEHTFTNPAGLSFHIGCFWPVAGCAVAGEPSTFWTWFPGYSWQVEGCASCAHHLGWFFASGGDGFHGLILDRLVEVESSPDGAPS